MSQCLRVRWKTRDGICMDEDVPRHEDSYAIPNFVSRIVWSREDQVYRHGYSPDISDVQRQVRHYGFSHEEDGRLVYEECEDLPTADDFAYRQAPTKVKRDQLMVEVDRIYESDSIEISFTTIKQNELFRLDLYLCRRGTGLMSANEFGWLALQFEKLGVVPDEMGTLRFGRLEGSRHVG